MSPVGWIKPCAFCGLLSLFASFSLDLYGSEKPCRDLESLLETLELVSRGVKNQCDSQSCWIHAANGMFEQSIRANQGIDISLSEDFVYARHVVEEFKAKVWGIIPGNNASKFEVAELERGNFIRYLALVSAFGIVPSKPGSNRILPTKNRMLFISDLKVHLSALERTIQILESELKSRKIDGATFDQRLNELRRATISQLDMEFEHWWSEDAGADRQGRISFRGKRYSPQKFAKAFLFSNSLHVILARIDTALNANQKFRQELASLGKESDENINMSEAVFETKSELLENLKAQLKKRKSVFVVLKWNQDLYPNGIAAEEQDATHAVEVVGFYNDYWIIRNSWGPSWETKGFTEFSTAKMGEHLIEAYYLE